jgi:hypothetical protein
VVVVSFIEISSQSDFSVFVSLLENLPAGRAPPAVVSSLV